MAVGCKIPLSWKNAENVIVVTRIFVIGGIGGGCAADVLATRGTSPCAGPTLRTTAPPEQTFIQPCLERYEAGAQGDPISALTMGCTSRLPCASTAPVPLFLRQSPGVPLEGGTLAEGTRILHCHETRVRWAKFVL